MLAHRYQKKMLKCNKNNYVYKKTIIIIKSQTLIKLVGQVKYPSI